MIIDMKDKGYQSTVFLAFSQNTAMMYMWHGLNYMGITVSSSVS